VLCALAGAALVSACRGGGDTNAGPTATEPASVATAATSTTSTTSTATTVSDIDPTVFTAAVLRLDDLGPGFNGGAQLPPGGADSVGLSSFYSDGKIRVQSSVVAYNTPQGADDQFQEVRRVFPRGGGVESNYTVPNMDTAYQYQLFNPNGLATFAVLLKMTTPDVSASSRCAGRRQIG